MSASVPESADRSRLVGLETGHNLPRRQLSGFVPVPPIADEPVSGGELPDRYEVAERDEGRVLRCTEAPGVAVSLDRGHAFSEAEARRLGERVIFVDGAGQFAPVLDDGGQFFNLDHHRGCARAFTLAACEQALVVVLKGLELDRGHWTIYANEPDLDTVFALWILLNHRRLRGFSADERDRIVPLIRLEGAIDANGFELAEFCGLPQDVVQRERERLDRLHRIELDARREGGWETLDLAAYACKMLYEIDRMVYRRGDFEDYSAIQQEYTHVDVGSDKVAVVCRDDSGIYEVEKRLKTTWGDRLGIVALERQPGHYTLRRSAALSGISLDAAYERLNLLDPVVDGRPAEKRWGGSDEIGGSPRPAGTGLTPREIAKILKLTYRPVRPWQKLQHLATAALWALTLVAASAVAVVAWRFFGKAPEDAGLAAALELAIAGAAMALLALLLTRRLSRGWTWLFGWRRPAGRDPWLLLPVVLAGAALGGAWVPRTVTSGAPGIAAAAGAIVMAAAACELGFRGLVHGLLILDSRVQSVAGRWLISLPTAVSGVLFAFATVLAVWQLTAPPPSAIGALPSLFAAGLAAGVTGLGLGMIRERSLSLLASGAALAAGGLIRLGVELWGGG